MAVKDLPREIWNHIFHLAADEDLIFQYGFPTPMAESAWFRNLFGQWTLRPPSEALNLIQRRSYATKKAIIATCKLWHSLGSESLFRSLFFHDPAKLYSLCGMLDSSSSKSTTASSSVGWWTRKFHLGRYHTSSSHEPTELRDALISVISHCPNLEIFIVDWPLELIFGPVVDALATHASKSLRTVHWAVSCDALPKVIWALDSLPFVISAHIDFETPTSADRECVHLGSASGLHLALPRLQQLSLRGHFQEFLEQATEWSLPALRSFCYDCGSTRTDQPDAVAFLARHGAPLLFLDLYCIPTLDVPRILDLCPELTTFAFNADWRLQPNDDVAAAATSPGFAAAHALPTMGTLVNRPHPNITSIGLHGLLYAFGVGPAAEYASVEPLSSYMIRRSNDLNVAALNRVQFPKLQRVRALSRTMLSDLNREDGPAHDDGGFERWERWWGMFEAEAVRLEDCTGAPLGTLPEDEEGEDEEDTDSEWGEGNEEWPIEIPPMPQEGGAHVDELRQLLEECRIMGEGREESIFAPMFGGVGLR